MTSSAPHAHDHTPIPCRRCGAPMLEDGSRGHVPYVPATVVVRCDYCGSREELPADAAQRVALLRTRLSEIRWAQQSLEAPALAIAQLAETYPKLIAPGVIFMVVVACLGSAQMLAHAFEVPAAGALRANLLLSALTGPLQIGFVLASVVGGAIFGLRRYATELRPLLEARPPRQGDAYRCRCCGGPIHASSHHGAFLTCSYCSTQNLLGPSTAAHRAEQLERELEDYRARARGQQPLIASAAARYSRHVRIVSGAVAVTSFVFVIAMSALQQLLATSMR